MIELDLIIFSNQYAKIKVMERSKNTKKIKTNFKNKKKKDNKGIVLKITLIYPFISLKVILLKNNN